MNWQSHRRTGGALIAGVLALTGLGGTLHDLPAHSDAALGGHGLRFDVAHEQPIADVHVESTTSRHVESCFACSLRRSTSLEAGPSTPQPGSPPPATVGFVSSDAVPSAPSEGAVRGRAPPLA